MRRRRRFLPLLVSLLTAVLVGVVAGRAATGSNTVPNKTLGYGSAATSPYTISNVAYTLNVDDPQEIGTVTFTISPTTARVVKVELDGAWYACTNTSGSVSCTTSAQINVSGGLPTTTLTVVATQ